MLLEKKVICKRVFQKGKEEFLRFTETICNASIELADICYVLPRTADSNELIVVKLKRDLKCMGYVYFETFLYFAMFQSLVYSKLHNTFYKDFSISRAL